MSKLTGDNYSDNQLIDKALVNDPSAFRIIIHRSERMVAQIIQKMVSDQEDRKDITQEIYIKAFRKLASFKQEAKLSTWICQIAYNTCIDYLRKKKIQPFFEGDLHSSPDEDADHIASRFISKDAVPDSLLQKKELSVMIRTQLEGLSPVYRTLVSLFHIEQLTYEEIGAITGLPQGTIKSYLSRARKSLRDNLLINYLKNDL